MKNFWTYITNGKYWIGCLKNKVFLYDNNGIELTTFKDIEPKFAVFSPVENIFIVKSAQSFFSVYSADTKQLLYKVTFAKRFAIQEDGMSFSPDGKYFINIEEQQDLSVKGHADDKCISIYETQGFTCVARHDLDSKTEAKFIEYGSDGIPYILGFNRRDDGVFKNRFIAKLSERGIVEMRVIQEDDYKFYENFKILQMYGFTELAKKWSGFAFDGTDMTGFENKSYQFKDLWSNGSII